jgi:hypothetical protein
LRARSNDPLKAHVPERTCILSRRTAPRDELIRLALGPDNIVAPDVRAIWYHDAFADRWLSEAQVAFVPVEGSPMGYGLGAVEARR